MKKILLIPLGICLCFSAFSQGFKLGPKAGISSAWVNARESAVNVINQDATLGFHAGAFGRISLFGFYAQPELLFTSAGGEIEYQGNAGATANQIINYTYNRLDMPLMFGYQFAGILRVQAGPVATLLLGAREEEGGTVRQMRENYNQSTIGFRAGFGIDIWRFVIDLVYEGSLGRVTDQINIGGTQFQTDLRQNQVILSLGYSFF
jgi:hypothetical protein